MEGEKKCPQCALPILAVFNFCPNCGKELKDSMLPIPLGKQISVYLISLLLPPLGLWPGIKYLLRRNNQAKKVGVIAIILTVIATVVLSWFTMQLTTTILQQLQLYQQSGIGY